MEYITHYPNMHIYECEDVDFIMDFLKSSYLLKEDFRGRLEFASIVVRDSEEGYRSEVFLHFHYRNLKDFVEDYDLSDGLLLSFVRNNPLDFNKDLFKVTYDYVTSSGSFFPNVDIEPPDDYENFELIPIAIRDAMERSELAHRFPSPKTILQLFIDTYLKGKAAII